jgi:hypothetical protein
MSTAKITNFTCSQSGTNIKMEVTYEATFTESEIRLNVGFIPTLVVTPGAAYLGSRIYGPTPVFVDGKSNALVNFRKEVYVTMPTVCPAGSAQITRTETVETAKAGLWGPPIDADAGFGLPDAAIEARIHFDLEIFASRAAAFTSPVTGLMKTPPPPIGGPTALEFNGVDTYIELNTAIPAITTKATVEMWMRGQPKEAFLFYLTDGNRRRQFSAHVPYSDGNVYVDSGADANNSYDRIVKALSPADDPNTWNHWAFVRDSAAGRISIYRNGDLWHEGTGLTRPMAPINRLVIGADGDGKWHHAGAITEVRVWAIVRSAADIKANMNRRLDVKPGLNVCYTMDSYQAGQPIRDRGISDRHGTMHGTPKIVPAPSTLLGS